MQPHWAIWGHRQPTSRPTRSALVTLLLAMMAQCDSLMMAGLAQARPLMDGLLGHLVSRPPRLAPAPPEHAAACASGGHNSGPAQQPSL